MSQRPIGAHRAAHRLARRTGLPVARPDISVLVERGLLPPTGDYHGQPLYDPTVIDAVDPTELAAIVREREAWLAASLHPRAAAACLGWRDDEFAAMAAERGITPGRFGRHARTDLHTLRADHARVLAARGPAAWARRMLVAGAAVVLDTETAWLAGPVCEIAVIDAATGATLLNTLIDPRAPIAPDATAVHGITDTTVAGSPTWPLVLPALLRVTADRQLLAYHSDYDRRVLLAECRRYRLDPRHLGERRRWSCLMAAAASGRRRPLAGATHRALPDCVAALRVLTGLAEPAAGGQRERAHGGHTGCPDDPIE